MQNQNLHSSEPLFDPYEYIRSLIDDLNLDSISDTEWQKLNSSLLEQFGRRVERAVAENVEEYELEATWQKFSDEESKWDFINQLVEISPNASSAVVDEMNHFYTDTINVFTH